MDMVNRDRMLFCNIATFSNNTTYLSFSISLSLSLSLLFEIISLSNTLSTSWKLEDVNEYSHIDRENPPYLPS